VWIQERIAKDVSGLPPGVRAAGLHLTTKRLRILRGPDPGGFSPSLGRPVPYAAFWFADALSLGEPGFARQMAIAMVYNSLATTVADDLEDTSYGERATLESLREFWEKRYLETLSSAFRPGSMLWKIDEKAREEHRAYDAWNRSFDDRVEFDPFSDEFLGSSSRYFVAVVLPPLAGLAIRARRLGEIELIERFLRDFAKGWRAFDDLMDWREDIDVAHYNRSSVLYYVASRLPPGAVMRPEHVLASFLSREFVEDTYGAILRNLESAAKDIDPLRNPYLSAFVRGQLEFHSKRRGALLRSSGETLERFDSLLHGKAPDRLGTSVPK
jgi:hypothetical protein